jgi:hypothetical protein
MQQKSLPHKTGSLSKIFMGIAMVGFFGIFSPNTAATAAGCHLLNTQHECESNSNCQWFSYGPSCAGGTHCYGLDDMTCEQTEGCFMSYPPADIGSCSEKY